MTRAERRTQLWRELLFDTRDGVADEVVQQRLALLEVWRKDPWAYKTGRDLDGRPIIWTVDELDEVTPVKPYPEEKVYLRYLTEQRWKYRFFFGDKARQMYLTTDCSLDIDWYCSFTDEREVFVSRVKEDSAIKLINDKIRTVHLRKPAWLQLACPIDERPQHIITYLNTNSTITGVAQNFAVSDARGPTGSLIFVDEAAYQEYFPQIYQAVVPMTARLWAVSTANVGNSGAALFKMLKNEGKPGSVEDD